MLGRARILSALAGRACLLDFNTCVQPWEAALALFVSVGRARGLDRAVAGASRGSAECLHPSDVLSEDIHQIPQRTNESLRGDAGPGRHKFIPEIMVGHRPRSKADVESHNSGGVTHCSCPSGLILSVSSKAMSFLVQLLFGQPPGRAWNEVRSIQDHWIALLLNLGGCLAFQHFRLQSRWDGMGWDLPLILPRLTTKLKNFLLPSLTVFLTDTAECPSGGDTKQSLWRSLGRGEGQH